MIRIHAKLGWRPDLPDPRDFLFHRRPSKLPPAVDLRPHDAPIYDQGNLGSCTGNAIAGHMQFLRRKEGIDDFTPSRLMIYYDERVIEGTVSTDAGAEIRDGIKSVGSTGACPEAMWPYDISQFAVRPTDDAYAAALKDRAVQYQRLNNMRLDDLRGCIADGFPFVFGFSVSKNFWDVGSDGMMPEPSGPIEGGHAVMAVGYDDTIRRFTIRNSWGPSWAAAGYFYMPYDFITGISCDDFWTIRLI